jgi:energy-coupling factor transporter ATP-binding protein EcfA2
MQFSTIEVEEIEDIRGVPFPRGVAFRDILVTGPLGSGKTTLVEAIHGWSEEGYVDLAQKYWWRSRLLTFRPREVHFGVPFVGHNTVVDGDWPLEQIERRRIQLPTRKRWFFNFSWRANFVFDFQLPPAEYVYEVRAKRAKTGSHRFDANLTRERVQSEVSAYEALALHFHTHGLRVFVRDQFMGRPRRIVDAPANDHSN